MIKLLKLIPARLFAKYLPDVLAYVLTKGLGWLIVKYPHRSKKVIETSKEITAAIIEVVTVSSDGVIDKKELAKVIEAWKKVLT